MSGEPERRLHPISLLLHIGAGIRAFIFPLLAAMFATGSTTLRLAAPVAVGVVAAIAAVMKYRSYTYRYDDEDLVVRTGIVFRNERHIPYARIQNIDAVQNVVHRFFDVAVVQVQTGSSTEPEATLKVLRLSDLAEMRERVLAERRIAAPIAGDDDGIVAPAAKPAPIPLLHLDPRELALAGFIENRGMALVAAAMGTLWQFDPLEKMVVEQVPRLVPEWGERAVAAATTATSVVIGGSALFVIAFVLIRLLSTVWALIRLYDFTLVRDGNDLRTEYGLFTRVTATIPVRRVQTISIHQRWLHRKLGRAAIRVTTAGASGLPGEGEQSVDREWLAPIVRVADVRRLIHEIDPTLEVDGAEWMPAHERAAARMTRVSLAWGAAVVVASSIAIGWWSLAVAAAIVPLAILRARGIARNLGVTILGDRVAFRRGWFHRIVSVVRFERIQSAVYAETLLDRRAGMALVGVDTPGLGEEELRMPYLPGSIARQMHGKLAAAATATPFTW